MVVELVSKKEMKRELTLGDSSVEAKVFPMVMSVVGVTELKLVEKKG